LEYVFAPATRTTGVGWLMYLAGRLTDQCYPGSVIDAGSGIY